jgi:hypothetical protein
MFLAMQRWRFAFSCCFSALHPWPWYILFLSIAACSSFFQLHTEITDFHPELYERIFENVGARLEPNLCRRRSVGCHLEL